MKKIMSLVLICAISLSAFGCASDKTIDYKKKNGQVERITFETYGLFNQDKRNPDVHYELKWGNIVWSVILVETIAVPIILLGWYLYEPVKQISDDKPVGSY